LKRWFTFYFYLMKRSLFLPSYYLAAQYCFAGKPTGQTNTDRKTVYTDTSSTTIPSMSEMLEDITQVMGCKTILN